MQNKSPARDAQPFGMQRTHGKLTTHFWPGCAPDLTLDELVWSHTKRSATKRRPIKPRKRHFNGLKCGNSRIKPKTAWGSQLRLLYHAPGLAVS